MAVYGRLGELSDGQLQAVLDRFGAGRLLAAGPLTDGLFGKNVALTTDRGEWVLRGDPWPMHVDDQFRRERFFAARVREACAVPVPWPYEIEPDPTLLGWPYALMPRMPGGHDRSADGAAALGRAAAALRAVRFDAFGAWSPAADDIEPFAGTAAEWFAHRVEALITDTASSAPPLVDSDLTYVRGMVPATITAEPTYVHHDLKPGNVVMAEVDGRLEVTGVFDLNEGLAADPIENLARAVFDYGRQDLALVEAFLGAYEDAAGVTVPRDLLRTYVVVDLLVIWAYGTRPENSWFDDPTFESWARKHPAIGG